MLYNIIGKRIFAVGSFGTPDIYEMPRNMLEATISKTIFRYYEIRLSWQDILNQKYRMVQDSNEDGKITNSDQQNMTYRMGSYWTMGVSVKF